MIRFRNIFGIFGIVLLAFISFKACFDMRSAVYICVGLMLLNIACKDMESNLVEDKDILVLMLPIVMNVLVDQGVNVKVLALCRLIVPVVLTLVALITRQGLGFGDVKIFTCLAFFLDPVELGSVLLTSIVLCGALAAGLYLFKGTMKIRELPFTPFIFISFLLRII